MPARVYASVALLAAVAGCGSTEFRNADSADAALVDAGGDSAGLDGGDSGSPPAECPPGMVQHSLGCIDAHEVTSADYAAFTAKVFDPALASRLPIGCIFKNAEHAYTAGHPELGSRPATDIDWCDAYAYCLSLDKHLCGLPGGGAVALAEAAVTTKSEWYAACSKEGSRVVPYTDAVSGTSQEAGLCVLNAGQTLPVDRSPNACEGGYPGLFDMVGNVEEWIDSCEGQNETSDCIAMGSAYDDDLSLADSSCGSIFRVGRNSTKATVGFRCCR